MKIRSVLAIPLLALLMTACGHVPGMPYAETFQWVEFKDPNCQAEPCKVVKKARYVEFKTQSWEGVAGAGVHVWATKLEKSGLLADAKWTEYELVAQHYGSGHGLWIAFLQGAAGRWGQGALQAYGEIHRATDNIALSNTAYGPRATSLANSVSISEAEAAAFAKANQEWNQTINLGMPMMGRGD